jgi:hypothetical protein
MYTLRIEHAVVDYARWKASFDADPLGRRGSGVRAWRVLRLADNDRYVVIDLDFADRDAAVGFEQRLQELWKTPPAAAALDGAPRTWLLEAADQA